MCVCFSAGSHKVFSTTCAKIQGFLDVFGRPGHFKEAKERVQNYAKRLTQATK